MKKLFTNLTAVIALVSMLFTASCSKVENPLTLGAEAEVTFSVGTPEFQTRAYGEGDNANHLTVAVYDENGNYLPGLTYTNEQFAKTDNVTLTLVNGMKYKIVFWAQNSGAPYTFDVNTHTLDVDYSNVNANDENLDAFYLVKEYQASGAKTEPAELTRPFAQLNVVTKDAAKAKDSGVEVTQTKVKVENVYTTMDMLTGDVDDNIAVEFALANTPSNANQSLRGYESDQWLSMNYLLVNTKALVKVTMTTNSDKVSEKVYYDVPVARNFRTIIHGNLLTSDTDFNVNLKPGFGGDENRVVYGDVAYEQVESATEASTLFAAGSKAVAVKSITEDAIITLPAVTETVYLVLPATDKSVTVEYAQSGNKPAKLYVTIPDEAVETLTITTPESTVYLNGNVTDLTAGTATNTLYITGGKVENLAVAQGNVVIESSGEVEKISQTEDNDGTTQVIVAEGAEKPEVVDNNADILVVENIVAIIGQTQYTSLNAAFDAANEAGSAVITLCSHTTLAEALTVNSDITLDLNGKVVSHTHECTASYQMITISSKGKLTVTGNGKISFKDTGAGDPNFGWGSYTIHNSGELIIENGTIEHLGEQEFAKHMICAVFQYSGSTTVNGGIISTPAYRSARLWKGSMIINGGVFDGQIWLQSVPDGPAELNINGGTFGPNGRDGSSVFVENDKYDVTLSVTGGTFNTKIGCTDANKTGLKGSVEGGVFTAAAKENTNSALIAEGYVYEEYLDNYKVVPAFVKESETQYNIYSQTGLEMLRDVVNSGNDFKDKTIKLFNDINLQGNWTSIGTEANPFSGTFEGDGKTIKNLTIIENEAKEGKAFVGFFGYAKDATVKNVVFENVNINIPCLDIDHSQGHIGAVAGSLEGTSTIENVTVKGNVKVYSTQDANGASRVAVVAGGNSYGKVTMKNVHVIANEGSYLIANNNTGALAGQLQGECYFENCSSNIDVTVNKFFAGGIIGLSAGKSVFTNCHTTGDIAVVAGRSGNENDHYRVGGIAGGWSNGATSTCVLTNCTYSGKLIGKNTDGTVALDLDYDGYVGRGYSLANAGSKVSVDGVEHVEVTSTISGFYSVDGVYEINKLASFQWFADQVNVSKNAFTGKTVKLIADIDLQNQDWEPIGKTGATTFNGVFDGQSHKISNLKVIGSGKSDQGLFGATQNGEIKNLTIENAKVVGRLNVGVVAGTPYTSKYTNINVIGHVEVEGMAYVGGVGGKNAYANWTDITVNVDETSYVRANSIEDGKAYRTYVGGVCGFNGEGGHTFKNIKSNIDVTGTTIDVGGLFGIAHYGNNFKNCSSSGDVEITNAENAADAEEIGGIAGVWHNQNGTNVNFTDCSFTGNLKVNVEGVDLSDNTIVGNAYSTAGTGTLIIDGVKVISL